MIPMTLTDVAAACADPQLEACANSRAEKYAAQYTISRVATDSREVQPGDLFFAIRGKRFNGHQFIPEAFSKGAVACVCDGEWFATTGVTEGHLQSWANSHPEPQASACAHARRLKPAAQVLVVPDCVEALGRLAAYYRRSIMNPATVVIAVTGTNGKTTVKSMIDHVLRPSLAGRAAPNSFNNQIGVPLTLLSAEQEDRYLIVEIGTNAPGEVATLAEITWPNVAVITSIGEAHLEGLTSIDRVAAEKASLLNHVRLCGLVIVNIDRPEINKHLWDCRSSNVDCRFGLPIDNLHSTIDNLVTVGTDPSAKLRVAKVRGDIRESTFELDNRYRVSISMPGIHHATNAAAAFAVARWFDIPPEQIIDRLRSFTPPPGRSRLLSDSDVLLVDDSYNANPASMAAAVETLRHERQGRRVFVMGDMLELGEASASFHRRAVQAVLAADIEVLVAVGAATVQAVRSSKNVECRMTNCELRITSTSDVVGHPTRVILCEDAVAASRVLRRMLQPGDVVWVKGSRAMGLDRVVNDLCSHAGRTMSNVECRMSNVD